MYRFNAGYNQSMQIYIYKELRFFPPAIDSLDDYHRARTFPIWLYRPINLDFYPQIVQPYLEHS